MSYNKPKDEWGLYRANPDAQDDNVMKLSNDCGCETAAACEDSFSGTIAEARTIKSITYDDVTYPTSTGALAKDDLKAFIQGVIDGKEVDGHVEVIYEGTTLTVTHIGEGTLATITYDNDSTSSLTRKCNLKSVYVYADMNVVGTVGPLVYDGASQALANEPYAWSGTPATDATTAAQLETDLGTALTALGVPNYTVSVAVDTPNSQYTISLRYTSGEPVKIGDNYVEIEEYLQQFFA